MFYPSLASGGVVALSTDGLGRFGFTFAWPFSPAGTPYFMQAGALDPAAPAGIALSNAIVGVTR